MSSNDGGKEYLFKIVIIGDSAVGKSNLLSRYARNEFNPHTKATIGVEFQTQSMEIEGKEVKAQIWDTTGQERFRDVTSASYRGAVGALIVYEITRRTTFDNVEQWLDELKAHSYTTVARMLVGNKCDLESIWDVSIDEGKSLAEAEGLFFMEASALDSTNVKKAFEIVIHEIYNNVSRKVLNSHTYKTEFSQSINRWIKVNTKLYFLLFNWVSIRVNESYSYCIIGRYNKFLGQHEYGAFIIRIKVRNTNTIRLLNE